MNHLHAIASKLEEYGLDAMLVTSAPGEFYAVGFHGEGVVLAARWESRYLTDSRYIEAARDQVTGAAITMTTREKGRKALLRQAVEELGIRRLGIEESYLTLEEYRSYEALPCELVPAQALLRTLRAVKDAGEQEAMRRAQRITDEAFAAICAFLRPGQTENEIAARLQYEMLCRGAERMSFDPIVASGPNGSKPHAVPGPRKVEKGEFLTMDFGCVYQGYCSDMTRTVALGEPTDEMKKVYAIVLEAQKAGIAATRAGVTGKSIDAAARKVIEDAGYGENFGHGYGHSVGIEIHESPNANMRDETLMPVGAVVSAEPGIYLPGRFGVRIEDVTILTEDGCIDITRSPKELIIL